MNVTSMQRESQYRKLGIFRTGSEMRKTDFDYEHGGIASPRGRGRMQMVREGDKR
jgi:hypothetical protein